MLLYIQLFHSLISSLIFTCLSPSSFNSTQVNATFLESSVILSTELSRSLEVKEKRVSRALQRAVIYIAHLGNGLSAKRNDSRLFEILMCNQCAVCQLPRCCGNATTRPAANCSLIQRFVSALRWCKLRGTRARNKSVQHGDKSRDDAIRDCFHPEISKRRSTRLVHIYQSLGNFIYL